MDLVVGCVATWADFLTDQSVRHPVYGQGNYSVGTVGGWGDQTVTNPDALTHK